MAIARNRSGLKNLLKSQVTAVAYDMPTSRTYSGKADKGNPLSANGTTPVKKGKKKKRTTHPLRST